MSCSICYDDVCEKTEIKTPCGHLFCNECLTPWLFKNTTCPMCRKDFSGEKTTDEASGAINTIGFLRRLSEDPTRDRINIDLINENVSGRIALINVEVCIDENQESTYYREDSSMSIDSDGEVGVDENPESTYILEDSPMSIDSDEEMENWDISPSDDEHNYYTDEEEGEHLEVLGQDSRVSDWGFITEDISDQVDREVGNVMEFFSNDSFDDSEDEEFRDSIVNEMQDVEYNKKMKMLEKTIKVYPKNKPGKFYVETLIQFDPDKNNILISYSPKYETKKTSIKSKKRFCRKQQKKDFSRLNKNKFNRNHKNGFVRCR